MNAWQIIGLAIGIGLWGWACYGAGYVRGAKRAIEWQLLKDLKQTQDRD